MKEKKAETLRDYHLKKAAHHLWLQCQLIRKIYGYEYDPQLDEYLEGKK